MKKNSYFTAIVKRAFDILFVTNPKGTSLGIFSGIVIHGVIELFKPSIGSISIINLEALQIWHFISLGVVVFNLPDFLKKNKINPKIEKTLKYIKQQINAGTVDERQAQQMYAKLHSKVLSDTVLDEKSVSTL